MTTDFEQWLGLQLPRATVAKADGWLERLDVGFYDCPVTPAAATSIVAHAWQRSTWLVSHVVWRTRADGTLAVHAMEFIRGMP